MNYYDYELALEMAKNLLELRIVFEDFYEDRFNLTYDEYTDLSKFYQKRRDEIANKVYVKLK